MSEISFSQEEILALIELYQERLATELRRKEMLQRKLAALNASEPLPQEEAQTEPDHDDSETEEEHEANQPKPVKRKGPPPIWANFILKRLRQVNHPLTYQQLTDDAMLFQKIEPHKRNQVEQAIKASAFRIRKVHGKIDTYHLKGTREVFVGLTKWFSKPGKLQRSYVKKINKPA